MNRGRGRQGFNKRGQAKNNKAPPAAHFPPPLKAIFVGAPPLLHKPPMPRKTPVEVGGVADFVKYFETTKPPPREKGMAADEKKEARQEKKKDQEAVGTCSARRALRTAFPIIPWKMRNRGLKNRGLALISLAQNIAAQLCTAGGGTCRCTL